MLHLPLSPIRGTGRRNHPLGFSIDGNIKYVVLGKSPKCQSHHRHHYPRATWIPLPQYHLPLLELLCRTQRILNENARYLKIDSRPCPHSGELKAWYAFHGVRHRLAFVSRSTSGPTASVNTFRMSQKELEKGPVSDSAGTPSIQGEDAIIQPASQRSEEPDIEKPPFVFTTTQTKHNEEAFADDDPRIKGIPAYVRRVVSLHDDPTLPTITFRYFLLSILFIVPGAFLSQMSYYRTTYAPYSVFFVQIASSYVGVWLAATIPAWTVRVPFTKWAFNLNPGPFGVKEHVLVTISAASGATYNLGYTPISMAELYFNTTVNPAVAIFFMWTIVWTGYSYAALARQFLIYDPQYIWFQS
jgi:hypothetical protein